MVGNPSSSVTVCQELGLPSGRTLRPAPSLWVPGSEATGRRP